MSKLTSGICSVQLPDDSIEILRERIELMVQRFGPSSTAAEVLARADAHAGEVRFWYSKSLGMLNVELLPVGMKQRDV